MKANSATGQKLISLFIDDALDELQREEVRKLIEKNSDWKREYRAMKKVKTIMSSLDKLAAPEDFAKRVSTSIVLSKRPLLTRFSNKLAFNLPRSPVFHYLGLVLALVMIVYAGSHMLLREQDETQKAIDDFVQNREAMDKLVYERNESLKEKGYKWYHLKLDKDGNFQISHIGVSPPQPGSEKQTKPAEDITTATRATDESAELKPKEIGRARNILQKEQQQTPETRKAEKFRIASVESQTAKKSSEKSEAAPEEKGKLGAVKEAPAKVEKSIRQQEEAKEDRRDLMEAEQGQLPPADKKKAKIESETVTEQKRADDLKDMEGMPIVRGAGKRAVSGEKRIFYADTTKPLISYPAILKIPQMKIKPSAWNNNLVALVYLDENGKVTNVIITRGTGDSRLDIEITRTLKGASFSPAVTEDGPVPCRFIIEIDI